ncbi:hypothetical protein BH582_12140 [Vibrio sp. 10N.222.47.A9]|nr:hypothetical protein BH582_12140 [Vibrio sp. 10N.222.47.A9]
MSVYINDSLIDFKESIDSILNQSYHKFEVYIYVDGPVKSEMEMFLRDVSNNDYVQVIFSDSNMGLAHALNELIDIVVDRNYFKYIARMDSDDISRVERLSKQVSFMKNNPEVSLSGAYCREFGNDMALECKKVPLKHSEIVDYSISRCPLIHPTVIFDICLFEKGFRYPTDNILTEDMCFWVELLREGFIFANLDDVVLDFRISNATLFRRNGYRKGVNELFLRFCHMKSMNRVSMLNIIKILSKFFTYLLPPSILKIAYKNLR